MKSCHIKPNYGELRNLYRIIKEYMEFKPEAIPEDSRINAERLKCIINKVEDKFKVRCKEVAQLKNNSNITSSERFFSCLCSGDFDEMKIDFVGDDPHSTNIQLTLELTVEEACILYYCTVSLNQLNPNLRWYADSIIELVEKNILSSIPKYVAINA